MSSSLPSFQLASELPPSPTREQVLEDKIREQATQLEKLQDGGERAPRIKPDELQKLIILFNTFDGRIKELEQLTEKQAKLIEDLNKCMREVQEDIEQIRLYFPKLISEDRRRLAEIEGRLTIIPQKKQIDRGEVLLALLVARNGKMMAKEARQKLGISDSQFSQLLSMHRTKIEVRPYHLDRRQNVLLLKSGD
ncbi:MAG: hypothetical protein M0Q43_11985 [Methanothrix sp.]|jgi:uncharacterized coiled-coil protein SlyX|nr:hypothetical protein [Methanothrix sp.]